MKGGDEITHIREKLGAKPPQAMPAYLNLLIYGEAGAGKTYLAGTAQDSPHTKPILFLDVEGGTVTLRRRPDIDVMQVRTMNDIEKAHNILYEDRGETYKTVIIDSLTELQKLDMKGVMQKEYDTKPDTVDKDIPTQRAYLKSGNRLRAIIQGFRDLPVNTIMTCLLATEFDETNGVTNYFPSLPGKLRGEVPGYFDVVGYLRTEQDTDGENVIRKLQVAKTKRVSAKDRTASLGNLVDNPSVPLLWEMIHSDNGTPPQVKTTKESKS